MRTKIYQIDKDTFGTKFMDYDFTMQKAGEIRPELYREFRRSVYTLQLHASPSVQRAFSVSVRCCCQR